MKERLTELLKGGLKYNDNPLSYCHDEHVGELAEHLLANGVIVLPCAVGDSCYPLWHSRNKPIVERKVSRITFSARNIIIGYYENDGQYRPPSRTRILGEDIFLTKEEAEKALERSEGK